MPVRRSSGWSRIRFCVDEDYADDKGNPVRKSIVCLAVSLAPLGVSAQTENFDKVPAGELPPGWESGVTGMGSPHWAVVADPTAPSKPNVLKQSGSGTYPWAVRKDVSIGDGFVETKFKAISGRQDQAGGIVWRWKNGRTYAHLGSRSGRGLDQGRQRQRVRRFQLRGEVRRPPF